MKFHIDDERRAIQDTFARALQDHCTPERRRAAMDAGATDANLWRALMDMGLGGLWAPEGYGGAGLGVLEMALVMETIGAAAAPGPFLPQALAVRALSLSEDTALRENWLPPLIAGKCKAALCVNTPWPGNGGASVADGGRLSATYDLVPGTTEADVFIASIGGGALALVEPMASTVTVSPVESTDRTRPLGTVTFEGAPNLPVTEPAATAQVFDAALVLIAADALGGAQRCLDMAVSYAKTREQFGAPIGQFQGLKHQLAQMALEVEPARALVWYAAHALDVGLPDASRAAALAKAHLTDRFTGVSRAAIEAHGGIGYTWDYDLQIWFRRAIFDRAWLGAPSLHRERAAALAGW